MKNNKKIFILILFSMASSVNAAVLVFHKTWTTGNASGHVEDNKCFFSSANARVSVSNDSTTNLTTVFTKAGTYSLVASTSISSEPSSNNTTNAIITVSK